MSRLAFAVLSVLWFSVTIGMYASMPSSPPLKRLLVATVVSSTLVALALAMALTCVGLLYRVLGRSKP